MDELAEHRAEPEPHSTITALDLAWCSTCAVTADLEGNVLAVIDARGIETQRDVYDPLKRSVHTVSADAGDTWSLADVAGQPIWTWKSGDLMLRRTYDALRRPVGLYVTDGLAAAERLHEHAVYGEFLAASADAADQALAAANRLRGRLWRQYDGAGQRARDVAGVPAGGGRRRGLVGAPGGDE